MADPNTSLPPRYDVADDTRNWVYSRTNKDQPVLPISPFAIVVQAQRALGLSADGAVGPATANALKADLQRQWSDAPTSYVQQIDEAVTNRRVNATLWTLIVAKALGVPYRGLPNGTIALGTTAQLPQVTFPRWNTRAPGGASSPSRTSSTPQASTPQGSTPQGSQGGVAASDAGASVGSQFSQFYERNKTPILIGGAVLLVGGIAAAFLLMKDDKGGGSSGGMSPRRAAALLGVPENADPSSIRAAYARSVRMVHPDRGYGGEDAGMRIRELQEARSVLESRSMQLGRSSGYLYEEDDEEYYSWGR